jgi:hypothetical protein
MSIAALVAGAISLGCDGGSTSELETPRLTVVIVSPAATQLELGQTQPLELIALDQFGNEYDLSDSELIWSTDNERVATISGDSEGGLVTAMTAGSTVIRAWADNVSDSAFVQVLAPPTEVTVSVRNQLVEPVAVEVNGVHRLTVGAGEIGKTRAPIDEPLQVAWSLVRPTNAAGGELGEPIGETFPKVPEPPRWMTVVVDAKVGSQQYFSPRVRNGSGADLLIGVNMDLPSESRCDCVVPDGTDMSLGYYPLPSGANVRGYAVDAGYTDALCAWDNLQLDVDPVSGRVVLSVPDDTGPSDQGGGFLPLVTRL